MGVKLMQYFDEAKKVGGLKAQMRLAIRAGISSDKARRESDSNDLINRVDKAWNYVRKDFKGGK